MKNIIFNLRVNGNFISSIVIRIIAVIITFYLQIWIVSKFGAELYGQYISFITLNAMLVIFAKGGLDSVILRQTSIEYSNTRNAEILKEMGGVFLFRGVVFSSVVVLIYYLLQSTLLSGTRFTVKYGWTLIYVCVIGTVSVSIAVSYLRGLNRPVIVEFVDNIVRSSLVLLFASIGLYINESVNNDLTEAYAFTVAALFVIFGIMAVRTVPLEKNPKSYERIRNGYSASEHFSFMSSGLLGFTFFQLDTLLLGFYRSDLEVGSYNMACNFVRLVIFVPLIVANLVQPQIAVAYSKKDTPKVMRLLSRAVAASLTPAVIAAGVLFLYGDLLLGWVEPRFSSSKPALIILVTAHLVNTNIIILNGTLSMIGRQADIVKSHLIGSVLTIALYYLLIPQYGQNGAAISVLFGLVAIICTYIGMYRRHVKHLYDLLFSKIERL